MPRDLSIATEEESRHDIDDRTAVVRQLKQDIYEVIEETKYFFEDFRRLLCDHVNNQ